MFDTSKRLDRLEVAVRKILRLMQAEGGPSMVDRVAAAYPDVAWFTRWEATGERPDE